MDLLCSRDERTTRAKAAMKERLKAKRAAGRKGRDVPAQTKIRSSWKTA